MSIEASTLSTMNESSAPTGVQDPALVVDWSVAIQQANLHRVQRLLKSHPDLLWTPLTAWDPERDASHVIAQLKTVQHLGSSLDNMCAIHYTLLQYNEPVPGEKSTLAQLQTGNLLWFLIQVRPVIKDVMYVLMEICIIECHKAGSGNTVLGKLQ